MFLTVRVGKRSDHLNLCSNYLGTDWPSLFSFLKIMMSEIDMAASAYKLPYQRLKNESHVDVCDERERFSSTGRPRSWCKLRRVRLRRFRLKVPSLRRFVRRKSRQISAVRVSCANVLKRFKEGRAHFGYLFAGNYLFTQVNPASLKRLQKSYSGPGLKLDGLPSSAKCATVIKGAYLPYLMVVRLGHDDPEWPLQDSCPNVESDELWKNKETKQ